MAGYRFIKKVAATMKINYNLKQKLNYIFRVLIFFILLVYSSKWFMIMIPLRTRSTEEIMLPFFLVNLLIFLIFILSNKNRTNIYHEYATCCQENDVVVKEEDHAAKNDEDTKAITRLKFHDISSVDDGCSSRENNKIDKSAWSEHEMMSDVEFNVRVTSYIKNQIWVWMREKTLQY
ncbi:hypothetical protein ACFE04_014355 [Oxalis oulophora]